MLPTENRPPYRWLKITSEMVPTDAGYEFRKDKGWRWLQRTCFWMLDKIGAHRHEWCEQFTLTPEEADGFLKALMQQHSWWLNHMHRQRCRIYMGPDEERMLMLMEATGMEPVTFMSRAMRYDRHGPRILDIPITVVPWIKGAFLVPDDRDVRYQCSSV